MIDLNAIRAVADRVEIVGRATLIQADCLTIAPLISRVAHVITDPPYEAITHKGLDRLNAVRRRDGQAASPAVDFAPIDGIRRDVVDFGRVCDGWFIAFCTAEGIGRWADAINRSPMKYKRACVWIKPDSMPQLNGQCPGAGAENFVCAWAGSGHSRWNAGGKRGVYTHCVNGPERHGVHPTEKPRRLMAEILADFTNPGETILDPFMGSGTTGFAAVQMGRDFIGIERKAKYFDIAVQRISDAQRQGDLFIEGSAA